MKIFSDFSLEVRVSIMPNRTKRFEDFELLVMFEKKIFEQCAFNSAKW